jgi:hypothetical protein
MEYWKDIMNKTTAVNAAEIAFALRQTHFQYATDIRILG